MTHTLTRNRIVVGVDGSAASDAAVRWAVREARLRHATVHLVCAYYCDAGLRAPYASWPRMTRQDERYAVAAAELATAAEFAGRYLPPGRLIAELANEPPVRALLDRAAGAEMLVLGTTRPARQPGQPALAMGPVARTCLRVAHCPVIVVTPDNQPAGHDPGRPRRHAKAGPPAPSATEQASASADAAIRAPAHAAR